MISRQHRDRLNERDLAAYADGSLDTAGRGRVERALAEDPGLEAELRTQRFALDALRTLASERAPAALRARVEPAPQARPRPRRATFTLATAGAAASAAAAAVILLGGGAAESPSVADAAVIGMRPAASSAPRPTGGSATFAQPRVAGLRFPYWDDHFGWKATGVRRDRLAGRSATTVFYRRARQTIAYTIVDGSGLRAGAATRVTTRRGTTLRSFTSRGRRVVTWVRRGHTCVLSGTGTPDATMLRLAAWRSGGDIAY
jgi:hypothetical protein